MKKNELLTKMKFFHMLKKIITLLGLAIFINSFQNKNKTDITQILLRK